MPLLAWLMTLAPHSAKAQLSECFSIRSTWSGATTTVTFNGNPQTDIEYSTDKVNWTKITETTTIPTYNKTYFRGNNPDGFSKSATDYVSFLAGGSSQNYYLEGNIMSLVNGSDFATNYSTIPADYCFYSLFTDKAGLSNNYHPVYWNAENLLLPADNLTRYCYASMFERTYIKTAPQLPAQHLAEYCYYKMYYTCISLDMRVSSTPREYILPAEELVPHCYEHMFGLYNTNSTIYQYVTIMATSLQDRRGEDIQNCLKEMFYFGVALTSTSGKNIYWYLQLFFRNWGDVSKSTCPTYNWFGGNYNCARNYFFYDTNLSWTVSSIALGSGGVKSQFPNGAYSCETNNCTSMWVPEDYDYLTFDCKTNGGTWEADDDYDTDLRRVVRAGYTAKTVPAAPHKLGCNFLGWFTAANGGTQVSEQTILSQTTAQTYYAHFLPNDVDFTVTIANGAHGHVVVSRNNAPTATYTTTSSVHNMSELTITAVPDAGYRFKNWTGDAATIKAAEDNGTTYYLVNDITVGAEFEADECTVTIQTPAANGSLAASDGVNNYASGSTYTFNRQTDLNKVLTFTATPATHRLFTGFTGTELGNVTSAPYVYDQVVTGTYTINASTPDEVTVGATFTVPTFTVTCTGQNGSFTLTADGYPDRTGTGTYDIDTEVTITANPNPYFNFVRWTDNDSDNPVRTVALTGDVSLTAEFALSGSLHSGPKTADVYASGINTYFSSAALAYYKILYALEPSTGADGITYRPVDLGTGVAWANKNVGAADSLRAGGYYYWGGTEPVTTSSTGQYYSGINGMAANANLPAAADAATQQIGSQWRMPTSTELTALLSTNIATVATYNSNYIYTNKYDTDKKILIPLAGRYGTALAKSYNYFWTGTLSAAVTSNYYNAKPYIFYNGAIKGNTTSSNQFAYAYYAMPVRAVYVPPFETCTITVKTYQSTSLKGTYQFVCEIGQTVNILSHANVSNYLLQKWTEDTNTGTQLSTEPMLTVTATADKTYCATFVSNSTGKTITTVSSPIDGGTVNGGGYYAVGTTVSLTATPAKGYRFVRWSDGNVQATRTITVTDNATYTAEFALDRTPASADFSVAVYQSPTGTVNKTKTEIKYVLPAADANGYYPVDLGNGLAWANKNVGAANESDPGSFFYWGGTSPVTSASQNTYWDGAKDMVLTTGYSVATPQYTLPADKDAATVNMGATWRMPTYSELYYLVAPTGALETGAAASGFNYVNSFDNTKRIFIPSSGYYKTNNSSTLTTGQTLFWGSTLGGFNANGYQCTAAYFQSGGAGYSSGTYSYVWFALPVRAVYQPPFETHRITIVVKTGTNTDTTYNYICEAGQRMTVTAYTRVDGHAFTNWTDASGNVVGTDITHTFTVTADATYYANISTTPANSFLLTTKAQPVSGGDILGGGRYVSGNTAVLTVTPRDGFTFTGWSDGNTDNPRHVTVTKDTVCTAVFAIDPSVSAGLRSEPATASVFGDGTKQGYTIEYFLPATDGNGYRPVDMGTGVAWANKNVGAANDHAAGDYFYWGSTTPMTNYVATITPNPFASSPLAANDILPAANDAATANMGANWRTPTSAEWTMLMTTTYVSRTGTTAFNLTNVINPENTIFLPNTGDKVTANSAAVSNTTANYYWTSTFNAWNSTFGSNCKAYYYTGTGAASAMACPTGMAVRGVYVPPFEVCTLTVRTYQRSYKGTSPTLKGTYYYICEKGQRLTVTAIPTSASYPFQLWANPDGRIVCDNPIAEFEVTEDAVYDAFFTSSVTGSTNYAITAVASPLAGGSIKGAGTYMSGSTTTLTATANPNFVFTRWSDGNTDNPRVITVTAAATYTAEFEFVTTDPVSPHRYVEVYKTAKGAGTFVEYLLPGADANGYRPVDLGSGVAWANKNIGAADSTAKGTYFYWGDTLGHTTFNTSQYYPGYTAMSANNNLPADADAATVRMGNTWRLPTSTEWTNLTSYATATRAGAAPYSYTVTNKVSGETMFLPAGGYTTSNTSSLTGGDYCYYWTSTLGTANAAIASIKPNYWYNGSVTSNTWYYQGMPVRAVYQPPFETCSLTVKLQTGSTVNATYVYVCEVGQQITISAYYENEFTTANAYYFFKWQDENNAIVSTNATETFTVTHNMTMTGFFQNTAGQFYTVTANAIPATSGTFTGSGPVLKGATTKLVAHAEPNYRFKYWNDDHSLTDPERFVTVNSDVTYEGVFEVDYDWSSVQSPSHVYANVYQAGTGQGTYLRYLLPGADANGYRPVDIGAGIAWANKNIGAADSTRYGSYFIWGGTTPVTSVLNTTYWSGVTSMTATTATGAAAQHPLPAEADAATVNMGANWRMPTYKEINDLINANTKGNTMTGAAGAGYRFVNTEDNTREMYIPAAGCYKTSGTSTLTKNLTLLWGSTTNKVNAASTQPSGFVSGTVNVGSTTYYAWHAMPVRGVYVPPFETCSVTVRTPSGVYVYICEVGQRLTVSAYPTTPASYRVEKWTDTGSGVTVSTDPTCEFVALSDADYTVTFVNTFTTKRTITATGTPTGKGLVNGKTTYTAVYEDGTQTKLIATPLPNYKFDYWDDDHSLTNPERIITVNADRTYTAVFSQDFNLATVTSPMGYANVYENGTNKGTYIRYLLPGKENGYRPVDVGTGIAWADRNIGAADSTKAGSYFYWGGTTPVTSASNTAYYPDLVYMPTTSAYNVDQYVLPDTADAAKVNMGGNWRMPTCTEIYNLQGVIGGGSTETGQAAAGYWYENNDSKDKIYIPAAGCYQTSGSSAITYSNTLLWGSTAATVNSSSVPATTYPVYYLNGSYSAGSSVHYCWHALPVRGVYQPPFETCSLKIMTGSNVYTYICEVGQRVTVSAYPTDPTTYRVEKWTDQNGVVVSNDPTCEFLVLSDMTYTVTFVKTFTTKRTITATGSPAGKGYVNGKTTYTAVYEDGTQTKLIATPLPNYKFLYWDDDHSLTNSERIITVNANATYTAVFAMDYDKPVQSEKAYANVYEAGTYAGTYIRYMLPGTVNGYRPVDVGVGIAWANKNVGATDSLDAGSYFYWGGTTPVTSAASTVYYTDYTKMPTTASEAVIQYPLPADADAATVNMGAAWRMPTYKEILTLADVLGGVTEAGTATGGYRYVNKEDNSKNIFIPSGGHYAAATVTAGTVSLWGSTVGTMDITSVAKTYPAYYVSGGKSAGASTHPVWHALPVRGVYVPPFETCSIKVVAGSYTYYFICEVGQHLVLSAYPKTPASYRVSQWKDQNSVVVSTDQTYEVVALSDATYTVTFTNSFTDVTKRTITANVSPAGTGTVNGAATYTGVYADGTQAKVFATPNMYYKFAYWDDDHSNTNPDRVFTVSGDRTFTAVFEPDAQKLGTASIAQNAAADTTKILYDLPVTTASNIFYTPIDMGNGTAWADRNVGAATEATAGSFFWWGANAAKTAFQYRSSTTYYYSGITSLTANSELPTAGDAAYTLMSSSWRLPSKAQWEYLVNNCSTETENTFVNPYDEAKTISLPKAGVYAPTTSSSVSITSGVTGYWSRTLAVKNTSTVYASQPWCYSNGEVTYGDGVPNASGHGYICYGMPVRAVYQPSFTPDTLRVRYTNGEDVTRTNTYLCQPGQPVTITAIPSEGYVFKQWKEDSDTHAERTIVLSGSTTLTAEFEEEDAGTALIIAQVNDALFGSVSGGGEYEKGTPVTLTATPNEHYHFVKWQLNDEDIEGGATLNFTATAIATYKAFFAIDRHTITTAGSNVTITGGGEYDYNTEVTLTATPAEHYHFVKWQKDGVDIEGTESIDITVTADAAYTAVCAIDRHTLTVSGENGTVTGGGEYDYGTVVTLTATADEHYHFVSWSDEGAATHTVTVTGDASYTATFAIDRFTLTINGSNAVVTGAGEYDYGTEVTVTVTPDIGYNFTGWTDSNTDNPRTVTMTEDKTLTYTLVYVPSYAITTVASGGVIYQTAERYEMQTGPTTYSYMDGTELTLEVASSFGYAFTGWSDGNTDNPRTVTVTEPKTYTAQFNEQTHIVFHLTEGTLDFPTYAKNTFAVIGETDEVTFRLYFGTTLTTGKTNYLSNLSLDAEQSYIQPAVGAKRTIASATVANVTYAGELFRAAHLVASLTDTEGRTYDVDIYTNYCINYATFQEDYRYNSNYNAGYTESSWMSGRSFEYGEDNHISYIGIPSTVHTNVLRFYTMTSNPYDVCHIWLQFNPLTEGEGRIPTGVYPINSTGLPGTVYVGSIPQNYQYQTERQQSTPAYYTNTGSWVYHDFTSGPYEIRYVDNWTLRGGYVEVVNVDEKYWVHVHAYTDGYKTNGEQPNTVLDFTAGGDGNAYYTVANLTIAAQLTDGTPLDEAVEATVNGMTNWTDVTLGQGTHSLFSGNTIDLTASKPGYVFDHWLRNGVRVNGEDFTYSYTMTGDDVTLTAVFTVDTRDFYDITTETGGRGTVALTADGYKPRTGSGRYADGTSLTMTVTPATGSAFSRWSDGNTQNPRTVTVTEDKTYTAEFTLESADQSVSVYQAAAADTMKILYNLSAKTGLDGKTYTPVDLGYGVAWADRNVGATSPTNIGTYFYWGDTQGHTSFSANQYYANNSLSNGHVLTADHDAATVNIGAAWRMPTDEEWVTFKNTAVLGADNGTFSNPTDNTKSVFLPATGIYGGTSSISGNAYYGYSMNVTTPALRCTDYRYYWSSVLYKRQHPQTGDNMYLPWTLSNNSAGYMVNVYGYNPNGSTTDNETGIKMDYIMDYYGMPVRAIYEPAYPTYTLTINVGLQKYQYICQAGQNVTVTANATVEGYVFDKWTEDDNTSATRTFNVIGNMSFTATFKEAPSTPVYDITIETDGTGYGTVDVPAINDVEEGTAITVSGNTLTVGETTVTATATAGSYGYSYAFSSWTDGEGNALPETVTEDLTVRANFTRELNLVLDEHAEDGDEFYDDFAARYNGETAKTVTLNRQFTQSRWATLCLPFEVSSGLMTGLNMRGRVYEFKHATGTATEGDKVVLYFAQAASLTAGKCYIVNANAKLAEKTQFVFPNVTINTAADKVSPLNSIGQYNQLPGYSDGEGTIQLVGTLRLGTLKGTESGNTYMGLKENKIYYPNTTSGSTVWAYRGIFRSTTPLGAQRIRIVVEGEEGETVTELEVVNGELQQAGETRKFVQDGILYIEHDGVLYDATGRRVN